MINVKTNNPHTLLNQIKAAIAAGHVTTWSVDSDGDFTHTPLQWKGLAWLRPLVVPGEELQFRIIFSSSAKDRTEVYAVYHGRFIEMLLAHFDKSFESVSASALLTSVELAR